jgi:hypothetical protein
VLSKALRNIYIFQIQVVKFIRAKYTKYNVLYLAYRILLYCYYYFQHLCEFIYFDCIENLENCLQTKFNISNSFFLCRCIKTNLYVCYVFPNKSIHISMYSTLVVYYVMSLEYLNTWVIALDVSYTENPFPDCLYSQTDIILYSLYKQLPIPEVPKLFILVAPF